MEITKENDKKAPETKDVEMNKQNEEEINEDNTQIQEQKSKLSGGKAEGEAESEAPSESDMGSVEYVDDDLLEQMDGGSEGTDDFATMKESDIGESEQNNFEDGQMLDEK